MTRLPKGSKVIDRGEGVTLFALPPDPRKKYPLWSIDALAGDIARAEASIRTFEEHIADQRRVIEERKQQIALCEERDAAIAEWEENRANSDLPSGNEND